VDAIKYVAILCVFLPIAGGKTVAADTLTVVVGGDVMLDRGVRSLIDLVGVEPLFADVAHVWDGADAVLVNLEGPVLIADHADPAEKIYLFRFEPEWLRPLKQIGITHLSLANNHTLDHGLAGFQETIDHVESADLIPVTDAPDPVLVENGDITVAIFAANLLDSPDVASQITEAVQRHSVTFPSDHIITYLHWGIEYQSHPDSAQVEIAHQLIYAGADAVIGQHPHVVQTIEHYQDGLIVYSLGNLLFDQTEPVTGEGWLVELRITNTLTPSDAKLHVFHRMAGVPMFTETRDIEADSR
jgi:poly-gamma-glutamate capsule biosynthesis protein CapA/YwtB (metallophosphatase superfamily)